MGGDERRSGEKGLVHVRNYFLNVIVTSKQKSRPETQHKKKSGNEDKNNRLPPNSSSRQKHEGDTEQPKHRRQHGCRKSLHGEDRPNVKAPIRPLKGAQRQDGLKHKTQCYVAFRRPMSAMKTNKDAK